MAARLCDVIMIYGLEDGGVTGTYEIMDLRCRI